MKSPHGLLFGPLAAGVLAVGVAGLPLMLSGYNAVEQTVSEIGQAGSPAAIPFAIMLATVAVCVLIFAFALRDAAIAENRSTLAAYFIGFMALSITGVALFPHPHNLHNVFGLSELVGYQAPLVFALTWRGAPRRQGLVALSWLFFALVWIAIAANLSSLAPESPISGYIEPRYGVAQRLLFAAWFAWCAIIGVTLFLRRSKRRLAA